MAECSVFGVSTMNAELRRICGEWERKGRKLSKDESSSDCCAENGQEEAFECILGRRLVWLLNLIWIYVVYDCYLSRLYTTHTYVSPLDASVSLVVLFANLSGLSTACLKVGTSLIRPTP
jgi:hypothetical protein